MSIKFNDEQQACIARINEFITNQTAFSKLIINGSGYLCPSFDENGNYFLSDNMIYINVKNEQEFKNLKFIIESKIAKYWLNQFRLNGFSDSKNIQIFPYIPYDNEISDVSIYKYFNLTQEEIDLIEKTIKD